jgi:hypothetical protein
LKFVRILPTQLLFVNGNSRLRLYREPRIRKGDCEKFGMRKNDNGKQLLTN